MKSKGKYVSMLSYFEIPSDLSSVSPHVGALWDMYLKGDEKFRNDRLKMIARCPKISFYITLLFDFLHFTALGSSRSSWVMFLLSLVTSYLRRPSVVMVTLSK